MRKRGTHRGQILSPLHEQAGGGKEAETTVRRAVRPRPSFPDSRRYAPFVELWALFHPGLALQLSDQALARVAGKDRNMGRPTAVGWISARPDPAPGELFPIPRGTELPTKSGFTLIELLVVLLVLGLLAAFVGPTVFQHVGSAKEAAARSQIEMLGAALDAYRLDNGRYPTTEQGLEALRREPLIEPRPSNWRGPYLRKDVPLDPWKNPYVYRSPGEANPWGYDLLSLGADGSPGGEGEARDIKSWE
jgi:general secretion pathway protein G